MMEHTEQLITLPHLITLFHQFQRKYPASRLFIKSTHDKNFLVRFADKKIVQNMLQHQEKIKVILFTEDQHMMEQNFNRYADELKNEENFLEFLHTLYQQAKSFPPLDYSPLPLAANQNLDFSHDKINHSLQTSELTKALQDVGKILEYGEELKLNNLAGFYQINQSEQQILTSEKTHLTYRSSSVQTSVSGFVGADYEINHSLFCQSNDDFNLKSLMWPIEQFAPLPVGGMELGEFPVLLSPHAMMQILSYAFYTGNFSAKNIREGIGPLKDYFVEGKPLFHPLVNLSDDPRADKIFYAPFDECGHIRKKSVLVQEGKLVRPLYNEREAQKLSQDSHCGQCLSFRSQEAFPYDLEMQGGKDDLQQMMKELHCGYYLHDVHYLSIADQEKMSLFGLTRGGLIEIKEGRPQRKLTNMRFEIQIPLLFNHIQQLGKQEEFKSWYGSMIVPSAIITKGFHFTEKATSI